MKATFPLVVLAFTLISCKPMRPPYDLVCINLGKKSVNNVLVNFNGHSFSYGILTPRMPATRSRVDEEVPLPDGAKVTWLTEEDGKSHEQHVDVKSKLTTIGKERGYLIVRLNDDNAWTAWKTEEQWRNTPSPKINFYLYGGED